MVQVCVKVVSDDFPVFSFAAVMSFYQGTIGPDKGSHPNDVIADVHALEMTMETMQGEKIVAKATQIVVQL